MAHVFVLSIALRWETMFSISFCMDRKVVFGYIHRVEERTDLVFLIACTRCVCIVCSI